MNRAQLICIIGVAGFMIPIVLYVFLILFRVRDGRTYVHKSTLLTPLIALLMVFVIVLVGQFWLASKY